MTINNSCINWYGGKGSKQQRKLLKKIINYINRSDKLLFVDVFGGSGVITLNVENKIKKYNDINKDLVNFFEVLKDEKLSLKLQNILSRTLYCKEIYEKVSQKLISEQCKIKDLNRAVNFYIATMQSINSIGGMKKSGFKSSKNYLRRGKGQAVSAWKTNIDQNLPLVIDKFRDVEVYNYDFLECIDHFDSENTIFYLDPPYVSESRKNKKVYINELEDRKHEELVEKILSIKGDVILSGYENNIYAKLEKRGWNKEIFNVKSSSTPVGEKADRKECIWCNFLII